MTDERRHDEENGGRRLDERDTESDGRGAGSPSTHTIERAGLEAAHVDEPNALLNALPIEEYGHILPKLTSERMLIEQTLVEPNVEIEDIYFPRVGVCSMLAEQQDRGRIEVGTIGPEGFIGIPVLLGGRSMPYRIIVQVEGDAWRMRADVFRRLADERPVVRHLLLRYTQYFTNQLSQSVACNRLHTLEERCARWVLMTHDRAQGDLFEMTQEFLSMMLGVHRPAGSVAMAILQNAGIVRYARGRVRVLDRTRLEEAACDCYAITRREQERLLEAPHDA